MTTPGSGFEANGYKPDEIAFLMKVASDFPDFLIKPSGKFSFHPPRTIHVGPREDHWQLLLFHELSHALLKHRDFRANIARLKMESAAWEKAHELAIRYSIPFDEDLAEDELDTYRDWLHQKSRCPKCGLTRFETPSGQYHCPRCENF